MKTSRNKNDLKNIYIQIWRLSNFKTQPKSYNQLLVFARKNFLKLNNEWERIPFPWNKTTQQQQITQKILIHYYKV